MPTIYTNLLAKGYFPKELPPHFFTELFARFAATKGGRATLKRYQPADKFTRCVEYRLALPGLNTRNLAIPHPAGFSQLALLVAKNLGRLLTKSSCSPISRSRPIYDDKYSRPLRPAVRPSNLSREQAVIRAASSYLLRVDVSQFYPSLYTHAIGWAVDSKLRERKHWRNSKLLGKRLDQLLMDMSGKESQGLPIGNDISFLLAELVLTQVDRELKVTGKHGYRWFDDYEIACATFEEAQQCLTRLNAALASFRLRINPNKTVIERLPVPTSKPWQAELRRFGKRLGHGAKAMVEYFDTAFALRSENPKEARLTYALGVLFAIDCPSDDVMRIALSGVTQSLLAEPGCAQKAFSLLTYWHLNGGSFDEDLMKKTIDRVVCNHRTSGVSSDVAWALAFCIEHKLDLGRAAAEVLSEVRDDCIAIQVLHMRALGLLSDGCSTTGLCLFLKSIDLDDHHWLLGYEAYRQGFLSDSKDQVTSNPLFSHLHRKGVTFYRTSLPSYAMIIHPGGAPEWIVRRWVKSVLGDGRGDQEQSKVYRTIAKDLRALKKKGVALTADDAILHLLDRDQTENLEAVTFSEEMY